MKILVTGSTGFLGCHAINRLPEGFEAVGLSRSSGHDLCDASDLNTQWEAVKPEGVLHLAAQSDPGFCESHEAESWAINVGATTHLAQLAQRSGVPLVFASSDLVFDGEQAPYGPKDPTNPLSVYGKHKVEAEHIVLEHGLTVARLPLMYDISLGSGTCFINGILDNWKQGTAVRLFIDEYRSPALAREVADCLWALLSRDVKMVHLGGPKRISRFDFGGLLAQAFGVSRKLIIPTSQADLDLQPSRPADVSLVERDPEVPQPQTTPVEGVLVVSNDVPTAG